MVGAVVAIYILDDHNLTTLHAADETAGTRFDSPGNLEDHRRAACGPASRRSGAIRR